MITFREFVSLKENFKQDANETYSDFVHRILTNLDHKSAVRFAYNAANMTRDLMGPRAKSALDIVKRWLENESDVSREDLFAAASATAGNEIRRDIKFFANQSAVFTVYSIINSPNFANKAVDFAADALANFDKDLYQKQMQKFVQLAKSLVADKKHDPAPSNQWFDKSDKDYETIAVWLDSLEEDGHLEILNQIKTLVQNTEDFQARANQDLAKLIVNSPHKDQYLHYIQNVFKGTK